jgi:hypothetical protein
MPRIMAERSGQGLTSEGHRRMLPRSLPAGSNAVQKWLRTKGIRRVCALLHADVDSQAMAASTPSFDIQPDLRGDHDQAKPGRSDQTHEGVGPARWSGYCRPKEDQAAS